MASPTYRSWAAMKTRCRNPNRHSSGHYMGRGIAYDPRWESFANFQEDMGKRPEGMTLERINNDLGYCKDNCRWATKSEQAFNRRSLKPTKTGLPNIHLIGKQYRAYCTENGKRKALYQGSSLDKASEARKGWAGGSAGDSPVHTPGGSWGARGAG